MTSELQTYAYSSVILSEVEESSLINIRIIKSD